jgi:predicted PurR-regulated permease PerM
MGMGAPPAGGNDFVPKMVEAAIRIGILVVLVSWCLRIVQPFVLPVVWGGVLAIALYPVHGVLTQALGGRRGLAATLVAVMMLVVLVIPAALLTETVLSGAKAVASGLEAGTLHISPPADSVRDWPLVGPRVHDFWLRLSENVHTALAPVLPHLQVLGRWLVSGAASAGFGLLMFVVAIIISGALMAHAEAGGRLAQAVGRRLAGDRGKEFVDLAGATIRSVARGILGVAMIQAVLAGLGFLAVGVPGAGLWALVALFLSVIQLGMLPIGIPIVIYVFYTSEPLVAIIFTVYIVFVGLIDNILKPLLLARGVPVPMLIIFIGAIGGFLSAGIVGLFVGSVVLALGYRLFLLWLYPDQGPAGQPRESF